MDEELMRKCLEMANNLWSDLFLGKRIRQSVYNELGSPCDDSREILGYRSAAVSQLAVGLFRDARESEDRETERCRDRRPGKG